MSDVQTLLARCQELGATLTPAPDGKLKVRAPSPLPDEIRAELKQRKTEILALLTQPLFPCPSCGGQVQLEPAVPKELPARLWTCQQCRTWGATRDGAAYPVVWVSSGTVQ